MKLEVFCGNRNCGEYVLDTDTDVLDDPLKGYMFTPRTDREWQSEFDNEAEGMNLTCPMCGWVFHVEQVLTVHHTPEFYPVSMRHLGDTKITGNVKKIKKFFVLYEPKPEPVKMVRSEIMDRINAVPVIEDKQPKPVKKKVKRGFFSNGI